MQEKYRYNYGVKMNKKTTVLLGVAAFLIIMTSLGIIFYSFLMQYIERVIEVPITDLEMPRPRPIPPAATTTVATTTESTAITMPFISKEIKIKIEATHNNATTSFVEFFIPEGALEKDISIAMKIDLVQSISSLYQIVGGIYSVEGDIPQFSKKASMTFWYDQKLVDAIPEKEITVGYFKENIWSPLPSTIDTEKNEARVEFDFLPARAFGLLILKEKIIQKAPKEIVSQAKLSQDSDGDGLSDIEESVYQTNIAFSDSDGDTKSDGFEIINLSNPLVKEENKLAISGLVNVYTNKDYNYNALYPASFIVRAMPETDNQEIIIVTKTSEYFSINVEENGDGSTAKEWYAKRTPSVDSSQLTELTIDGNDAILAPDSMSIYIHKGNRIYILGYSLGVESEANFKTTFQMLINSFKIIEPPPIISEAGQSENAPTSSPEELPPPEE